MLAVGGGRVTVGAMTILTDLHRHEIALPTPEATDEFAARLGAILAPGDVLLLQGPIGAGKTHFARALIKSLLITPEDVPSPTYTLVQTYDGPTCEIWHSDLYRLSHPDDVLELGLSDAFEQAICLVEWPDRLGDLTPDSALWLTLDAGESDMARRLVLAWSDPRWATRLKRVIT